ncbi:SDR family NAD(P)-dependent oxidoreductase [Nocardia rhamnosiphila]|uniref:SDR family NAD(P)-dependent oxidoreductase n=1 Tax=Nocardia rhamnosiphila TaxID=426716 RepID=UPI0027E37566|nr:SDR family NAD(P)-dependent oxidoreductase [Nocardia zapadnayensis]
MLQRSDNVAATTRSVERLTEALGEHDAARLLPLGVDLADQEQVQHAVAAVKGRFAGLDVVVNNAGYGFLAAVEEVTDTDAREIFDRSRLRSTRRSCPQTRDSLANLPQRDDSVFGPRTTMRTTSGGCPSGSPAPVPSSFTPWSVRPGPNPRWHPSRVASEQGQDAPWAPGI